MQNLKIRVNNEAEAEEVKRLAVKAGYTLDALFGKKWSAEFCYLLLCEDMSAGFANEIMADGDKPLSIGELWAMTNPMREHLDSNRNYEFVLSTEKDDGFIEIPEGAEIAIQFKNEPDEHGIVFYKNDGKSCMSKNDNNWQHDSMWSMDQLLNENYHDGEIDLSHDILWQREQDEPFLTPECTLNDQYAEIEKVRQAIKVKSGSDSDHALDAMSFGIMGAGAASGGAKMRENNHYFINVSDVDEVDFYEIAKRYNVTDPAVQHILKKCLAIGNRGHKDLETDLKDILKTAKRALQINGFGD